MMVMPSNCSQPWLHYLAGRYRGSLGHLFSIGQQHGPYEWLPYVLDNARFPAWLNGRPWDEKGYLSLLEWAAEAGAMGQPPLWALVPDCVADRDGTLREWELWSPLVQGFGFRLAFAVQDGMTPGDVPSEADVLFVGGTKEWKWASAGLWCALGRPVHIGRVSTYRGLVRARDAGATSADGTGWVRGDRQQLDGLRAFLAEEAGEKPPGAQGNIFAQGD